MKVYIGILIALGLIIAACGKEVYRQVNIPGPQGASGNSGKTGADGYDGVDGNNGHNSLVDLENSLSCANGGTTILSGLDLDDNGVLDSGEVISAKDVCNGAAARKPGLSCNLHNLASWDGSTSLPQALAANPPVGNFTLANFNVPDSQSALGFPGMPANLQALVGLEGYALDCSGYLYVPTSGAHSFSLLSDDGSRLVIEDNIIIQNQGLHAPQLVSVSNINLNRGPNRINVVYYQGPHTQVALQLKWTGPNTANQVVPAGLFTHE